MKQWLILSLLLGWATTTAFGGPPQSPGKSSFTIPVTHPDARWKLEPTPFAQDTNLWAHLDGPRHEVMWMHMIYPTTAGGMNGGGRYAFMSYDARTERFHAATSGAAGYLDGPFSRARFYVDDYHGGRHERGWSPDGRFYYQLASGQRIRSLDFAEQMVRTLPVKGVAYTCGESGKLYVVQDRDAKSLTVLSPGPEWKVLSTTPLQGKQTLNPLGTSLAVDEKRGRLYGTTYGATTHYVWYWDLKDGSFHGVLPNSVKEPDARKQGEAGPFKGTVLYNHGEISWGPDDPDRRFLYVTRVDDNNLYRLDLNREIMSVFSVKQGGFLDSGKGDAETTYSYPPFWLPDGSFLGPVTPFGNPPHYRAFKRIK